MWIYFWFTAFVSCYALFADILTVTGFAVFWAINMLSPLLFIYWVKRVSNRNERFRNPY